MNENEQHTESVDAAHATAAAEEQGLLFTDDVSPLPSDTGYRGPTACNAAGITYRQLDYWARTGLVEPSVREAAGSGTQRLYAFRDILVLKVGERGTVLRHGSSGGSADGPSPSVMGPESFAALLRGLHRR